MTWYAILTIIVVAPATFIAMEGVAWAAHKYLMHGPLWFLHESHHRPGRGGFELNDLHGLFFAALAVLLMLDGPAAPLSFALGAGMAAYGLAYFLLHDVLVHRRVRHLFVPRSGYLRRVYLAHRLHHARRGRDGAVSFGFIIPGDVDRMAARLRRGLRREAGPRGVRVTAAR